MSATLDPLVMDLVQFVAANPRPYDEVIEAWRTSCPRLTVWEDAIDSGLVLVARGGDKELMVSATSSGLRLLRDSGRLSESAITDSRHNFEHGSPAQT